jgi:hypothetical protein
VRSYEAGLAFAGAPSRPVVINRSPPLARIVKWAALLAAATELAGHRRSNEGAREDSFHPKPGRVLAATASRSCRASATRPSQSRAYLAAG